MSSDADSRLTVADRLDEDADSDWRLLQWVSDLVTERCRSKREQARQLREEVAREREVRELVDEADQELVRWLKGRRVA